MLGTVEGKMTGSTSLSYTMNMSHKMQEVKKRPMGEGQRGQSGNQGPTGSAHSDNILALCMLPIHSLPFSLSPSHP